MFQKALGFIKGLFGSVGLLTPLLALFGVVMPPVAIALAPVAIGLMSTVEDAWGDGQGPIKKEAVTAGLTGFTTKMQELSTGGQKETWNTITPEVVSTMIDVIAGAANSIAKSQGTTPVFDDSVFEAMKAGR